MTKPVPTSAQDFSTGRSIKIVHDKGVSWIPWSTWMGASTKGGKLYVEFVGYRVVIEGNNLEILAGKIANNTFPVLERNKTYGIDKETVKIERIGVQELFKQ